MQRLAMPVEGGTPTQVTRFDGSPVRFLSAARDGTLAFGHDGLLYTLPAGADEPRRVPVTVSADWKAVREMYEKFLPHIGNNHELAELLSEMLGELNVSHSGARYTSSDPADDATASLGIFYDQSEATDGLRVTEVMAGGPLDRAGMDVEPGAVIEAMDGRDLTPDVEPARLLSRKAGQNVLLRVRDPDGTVRELVVKPITLGEEGRLLYERWVEVNRREVEERSGGRLGYVHVQGMNDRAFRSTYEEVMGRYADMEGIVVDTRFNPGGLHGAPPRVRTKTTRALAASQPA